MAKTQEPLGYIPNIGLSSRKMVTGNVPRFCCLTTLVLMNGFQKWLHKNQDGYHSPLLVSDGLQNIMNVRMRNFKEIMTLWIKAWNHYDHFPTPKFLRKNKLRFTDFGRESRGISEVSQQIAISWRRERSLAYDFQPLMQTLGNCGAAFES